MIIPRLPWSIWKVLQWSQRNLKIPNFVWTSDFLIWCPQGRRNRGECFAPLVHLFSLRGCAEICFRMTLWRPGEGQNLHHSLSTSEKGGGVRSTLLSLETKVFVKCRIYANSTIREMQSSTSMHVSLQCQKQPISKSAELSNHPGIA